MCRRQQHTPSQRSVRLAAPQQRHPRAQQRQPKIVTKMSPVYDEFAALGNKKDEIYVTLDADKFQRYQSHTASMA